MVKFNLEFFFPFHIRLSNDYFTVIITNNFNLAEISAPQAAEIITLARRAGTNTNNKRAHKKKRKKSCPKIVSTSSNKLSRNYAVLASVVIQLERTLADYLLTGKKKPINPSNGLPTPDHCQELTNT